MKQTAVIVLGMHRSGTSLIAKAVNLLGVYIGEEKDLIPPRKDNPTGFWEHQKIVEFHDRLFREFQRNCNNTKPLPKNWLDHSFINSYIKTGKEIITDYFSEHSVWGCKDPRMCMFMPLWNVIFEELGVQQKFIISYRNPIDVAKSLEKRNGLNQNRAIRLWYIYMLNVLNDMSASPIAVIDYNNFLLDPKVYLTRIAKGLGIELDANKLNKVKDFISFDLQHSISNQQTLDTKAAEPITSLFRDLKRIEQNPGYLRERNFQNKIKERLDVYCGYFDMFDCAIDEKKSFYAMETFGSRDNFHYSIRFDSTGLIRNGEINEYSLKLRYLNNRFIRFDPVNFPTVFSISDIKLYRETDLKNPIYDWKHRDFNGVTLFNEVQNIETNGNCTTILSTGNNPVLHLNHPLGYREENFILKVRMKIENELELSNKIVGKKLIDTNTELKKCEDEVVEVRKYYKSQMNHSQEVLQMYENKFLRYLVNERSSVFIWGAGSGGEKTLSLLRKFNVNVEGFIDSNPERFNGSKLNIKIYSPDMFFEHWSQETAHVIVASVFHKEIIRQLTSKGFEFNSHFTVNVLL